MLARLVLVTILLCRCEFIDPLSTEYNIKRTRAAEDIIKPLLQPSFLVTKNLNHSYPVTLLSKLFSSVPKREYAVQDISLQFGTSYSNCSNGNGSDGVTVLIGRSGSGKSSLLRLLSGSEPPRSGKVMMNGQNLYSPNDANMMFTKPIILDRKVDCYEESISVLDCVINIGIPRLTLMDDETKTIVEYLAIYLLQLLEIDQLFLPPSQLTPSGQYLYGIACACMKSICANDFFHNSSNGICNGIPYPILLLDELLDKEHKTVSAKVGKGLWKFTESGGIVIVATHRPDHWKLVPGREVTLNSGRVLAEKRREVKYGSTVN